MKFGENWDIRFCVLLLELQQGQFGARNTDFGVGGGMKSSHLCMFSSFKLGFF